MKTEKDHLLKLLNEVYTKIQFDEDILKEDVQQKEVDLLATIVSIIKRRHKAYQDKQTLVGKFKSKITSCIKDFNKNTLERSEHKASDKHLPMFLKVDEFQKVLPTDTNNYVNQYKN